MATISQQELAHPKEQTLRSVPEELIRESDDLLPGERRMAPMTGHIIAVAIGAVVWIGFAWAMGWLPST